MLPNKCIYITADFSSNWRSGELFFNYIFDHNGIIISLSCLGAHMKSRSGSEGFCAETFDYTGREFQPHSQLEKKLPPNVLLSVGCRRLGVSK